MAEEPRDSQNGRGTEVGMEAAVVSFSASLSLVSALEFLLLW